MGFPQYIEFTPEEEAILDQINDEWVALNEAKRAAEAAAPIVLTVDADEPADVTDGTEAAQK